MEDFFVSANLLDIGFSGELVIWGMPYFPLFNVENGGFSENIYIFASSDIIFYMEQEL